MVDQRCPKCRYYGYTSVLGRTCDYLVITGHSRTAGLTAYEKAGPCKVFDPGRKERRIERIAFSVNGRYTLDQQKLRELYFQGFNDAEISRKAGCSITGVRGWRKRHNLAANAKPGFAGRRRDPGKDTERT